jgi:hypothetical protein
MIVPVVFLITVCAIERWTALVLVVSTAVNSFVVMLMYQPLSFAFGDEFQHYETLHGILSSGHLFGSNTDLPVSPKYAALEIIASCVSFITHLSPYVSGMLTAGVTHVVTLVLVFEIVYMVADDDRTALLASVLYTLNPQYQFLDSYFTYTATGLLFAFATVLCVLQALARVDDRSWPWAFAAVACGAVCVVSHHVSSYICLAFLLVIFLRDVACRDRRRARVGASILVPVAVLMVGWTTFVASDVIGYLSPLAGDLIGRLHAQTTVPNLTGLRIPRLRASANTAAPSFDRYTEYAGALVLVALYTLALDAGLRSEERGKKRWGPVEVPFLVTSLVLYVIILVRLGAPDGSELAARLYAYGMLPVACFIAPSLTGAYRWRQVAHRRRWAVPLRGVVVALLVAGVWAGDVAGGWPPSYARLPGPELAAGWERSADPAVLAASDWAAANLPPYRYFISDEMTAAVFSGIASETEVATPSADVFLAGSMTGRVLSLLQTYDVNYIVLNMIVTRQLPADGAYFTDDPLAGRYASPVPVADVTKFLHWTGGSVVYNNAQVAIVAVG